MKIYIGADHRGFELKEEIKSWLEKEGYEVVDVGAHEYDPEDDYPDYAVKVVKGVVDGEKDRGILICGSGHGVDIVANRYKSVRSIIGFNDEVVVQGREHENANVLTLASEWVDEGEAKERVRLFLLTEFSGKARHERRIKKISNLGGV